MACVHPIRGVQDPTTGKIRQVSDAPFRDDFLEVPCGQCVGCRLERSRQWATRIMHEAQMHQRNCFITLTYTDEHIPTHASLRYEDFREFMRKLRRALCDCGRDYSKSKRGRRVCRDASHRVRYFHCGEYGDRTQRPHYHAAIFGHDFKQGSSLYKTTSYGDSLWTSELLTANWDKGYHTVGNLTFESAAYVARYIMKKVTGDSAHRFYNDIDYATGEVTAERKPEYITMSRRPGIGSTWFDRFAGDVYPSDEVITRGQSCRPPKFYDRRLERINPSLLEEIKERRKAQAKPWDNTPDRRAVKEAVMKARLREHHRGVE